MQFSSAYLYGSGMSEGQVPTPVLPSNVIFDQGVFNMNRMKAGFALDNILPVQDVYSGIPYWQGRSAITDGGYAQQIQDDDGLTFVNYGTDKNTLSIVGGALQHIGTSPSSPDADGSDYYLPIDFANLIQEGYSKFYVDLDYSRQGILTPPVSMTPYIDCYVDYIYNNVKIRTIGGGGYSLNYTDEFQSHKIQVDLGGSGLDFVPAYVELRMTHGTYNIYKMWFE